MTRASTDVIIDNYFDIGYVQQSFTLHTKGANNNYGGKMIQVLGPLIWNRIPKEIQEVGTVSTFKKQLKLHIFNLYRGDPVDREQNNDNVNLIDINRNLNNRPSYRNHNNHNNNNQRWRQNVNQPFMSRWNQS